MKIEYRRKMEKQSSLMRFLDILLVARYFEFVLDLSPEQCSEQLLHLSQSKKGFWSPASQDVKIQEEDTGIYKFQTQLIRYGRSMGYTSVLVTGLIVSDIGIGKTIVSGKIKMGLPFIGVIAFFLSMLLLSATSFVWARDIIWITIIFLICSFYIARSMNDYNRIYHQIDDALLKTKISKA